ncbi:MAG: permease prefix domain 1-containing protein [Clostridia bacterium]|nr:permease prefix domain 1-containing protein [Clostridia bacterium]
MITIKEYVERLFRNIPDSEESRNMKQEIIQNLQEKVADLMESGKSEEDAINKAIVDFGDFDEIRSALAVDPEPKAVEKGKSDAEKYKRTTNALLFSIFGSIIIIGLMVFINYYYSPYTIWWVYPLFAVIWWPLALFFTWLNRRNKR